MFQVASYLDFLSGAEHKSVAALFIFSPDVEQHLLAKKNLENALEFENDVHVFTLQQAHAGTVISIYEIDLTPCLLIFAEGKFQQCIKGCHEPSYYYSLLSNASKKRTLRDDTAEKFHPFITKKPA